jgi:transcriptional regulator NrdR family protein
VVRSQLKVVKADGDIEEYIHTKVIGSISNALSKAGRNDVYIAEQLADVVTYYLYNQENIHSVRSGEIFSIIVAILTETGYEDAADALCEYHFRRKMKRLRTEVIPINIQGIREARMLANSEQPNTGYQWDKSKIVDTLIREHDFDVLEARMIASVVEDRIFNMEITKVPTSLIKQIVLSEAAMVMRAQKQLLAV